ncbi:MAG: hypothetical protein IJW37_03905 [Lachnospiraceae bacterium]|nr:hypothetical protein [Lachnospiraceae bacterium]
MKKIGKMNEIAWVLGIVLCALGVCLSTKADFGLSMIAAPAYILHVGLVKVFPWFSQGTAEYVFQGALLILLCIAVQKFRLRYLLSFGTAILFGLALDLWFVVFGGNGAYEETSLRIAAFVLGTLITGLSIAFFFRTKLPQEIYELFVTELSTRYGWKSTRVKQIFDFSCLALSLVLAFFVNRSLEGIGIGTVIVTIVNASVIALFGKGLDKLFIFDSLVTKKDRQ